MTKKRTAGFRSEAKKCNVFSERKERTSLSLRLNGLPVLDEKAYDFLDASPLNAGGHAAR